MHPDQIRFESKYIPEPNSGCWLWIGSVTRLGYGMMHLGRKNRSAHRISYYFYKGPIELGMQVQHTCDVRCCVNPDHLILGTQLENMHASSIRKRYPDRMGSKNARAKLTEQDATEIRHAPLVKRGDQARLARKYGVDDSIIRRIKDFKVWKNVK